MPSTSFVEHMLCAQNIIVPSPFKKALFWPEPTIKKKGRILKEKLPSTITSEAWREFHRKKELEKKIKKKKKKNENKKE